MDDWQEATQDVQAMYYCAFLCISPKDTLLRLLYLYQYTAIYLQTTSSSIRTLF